MNKFKNNIIILSAAVFIVLFIAALMITGWNFNQKVSMLTESPVGVSGPLVLKFDSEMDHESVERNISIYPETPIEFVWNNQNLSVFPIEAFIEGADYNLELNGGYLSSEGDLYKKTLSWNFSTRNESILFLYPASEKANIWRLDIATGESKQITKNDFAIYDYSVSNDGNSIIYSKMNESGGYSLWIVDRNGDNTSLLIDCAEDWCIESDWSRMDDYVAFTRITFPSESMEMEKHIWLLDVKSQQNVVLISNPKIYGETPLWSPDARYLAFFEPEKEFVHILDMKNKILTDFPAVSGIIGSWIKEENKLIYIENNEDILSFVSVIFEADPGDGIRIESEAADLIGEKIISRPLISPDDNWVLLAAKDTAATGAQQLWIVHKEGEFGQMITDDYLATHSAYSWDHGGTRIVYQRLMITSSDSKPEILVWDRECHTCKVVFRDASFPKWLP